MTLVIVSLIVTVLMQALAQTLDMRQRLLRHQSVVRMASLEEQWFRDSVASAIADLADARGAFTGTASSLEFVSAGPLGGQGIARVGWAIVETGGRARLVYTDPSMPDLAIIEGGLARGRFEYLDGRGEWTSQWPAGNAASRNAREQGDRPAREAVLPRMVRLTAETPSGSIHWSVAIDASPFLRENLRPDGPGGL